MDLIISVEEAREILGSEAEKMTDEQLIDLIQTLDVLAVEALRQAREKRKEDAMAMAQLIYDIYGDKQAHDRKNKS
jgi:hypothetical protein